MVYTVETTLRNFNAWSGAKDTLNVLIDGDFCNRVEELISGLFGHIPSDVEVNDFLWFETDFIAKELGFDSFDALIDFVRK